MFCEKKITPCSIDDPVYYVQGNDRPESFFVSCIIYIDNQFLAMLSGYDGTNWSIGYAHSNDGIHFEKYSHNPLFMYGSEWESSHVQLPLLFYNSGEYYMFYAGAGTYFSEGFATRSR